MLLSFVIDDVYAADMGICFIKEVKQNNVAMLRVFYLRNICNAFNTSWIVGIQQILVSEFHVCSGSLSRVCVETLCFFFQLMIDVCKKGAPFVVVNLLCSKKILHLLVSILLVCI